MLKKFFSMCHIKLQQLKQGIGVWQVSVLILRFFQNCSSSLNHVSANILPNVLVWVDLLTMASPKVIFYTSPSRNPGEQFLVSYAPVKLFMHVLLLRLHFYSSFGNRARKQYVLLLFYLLSILNTLKMLERFLKISS